MASWHLLAPSLPWRPTISFSSSILRKPRTRRPRLILRSDITGRCGMKRKGVPLSKPARHPKRSVIRSPTAKAEFGLLALTVLSLFYSLVGPGIASDRKVIFNVWVALCVAGSAAFLGGDAVAKGTLRIPIMNNEPLAVTAIGGIGRLWCLSFGGLQQVKTGYVKIESRQINGR
jgi:hypothetical protein